MKYKLQRSFFFVKLYRNFTKYSSKAAIISFLYMLGNSMAKIVITFIISNKSNVGQIYKSDKIICQHSNADLLTVY